MRQLLVLAAVAGLAIARPEMYREQEDFKFSRSSSDEGSKSGFYGAQRGNMGGNYERAHNMDPLAQNQMSGLVRQVEGELGDGAKQNTGSVYTAANSRGTYGSGHYDLSNLEGRNFHEGASYGDSQSHSSMTSHSLGSGYQGQYVATSSGAGYGRTKTHNSRYAGYNSAGTSDQALNLDNHQASSDLQLGRVSGNIQSASQHEDRNTAAHSSDTQYYSQSGYHGQAYDQGNAHSDSFVNGYGSNQIRTRLVNGTPVKIIIQPGTRVSVPVAAQSYDASQSAASFDQNAINSEAEVLTNNDQHIVLKPIKPKSYESSYSYRKEWEKHDTKPVSGVPLAIPTLSPYPVNSELYDEQQQRVSGISSQSHQSSQSGYNINSASSSQSRNQAEYNTNAGSSAFTKGHLGKAAYNRGAYNGDATGAYTSEVVGAHNGGATGASSLTNQLDIAATKPKSYQSSYSYHKSWEHQGDPYVIIPSTNDDQHSAALTNGAYDSHQYGTRQHQSHQRYSSHGDADCDENGHVRVARSYDSHRHQEQQSQDIYEGQEDLGQQTQAQWGNIEDLGQQTQNKWDTIEDLGQQTQNKWDQLETGQQSENKWDRIEDLGQHAQTQWDQEHGQQTQNTWDKLELTPQSQTDLGQQTQETWSTLDTRPIQTEGRITEQKETTQTNSGEDQHGMNIGFISQTNAFDQDQSLTNHPIPTEPHTLNNGSQKNSTHHVHTIWDEIKKEEIGQETEDSTEVDLTQTSDLGQQTQVTSGNINQNDNSWHQSSDNDQFNLNVNSEQHNQNHFDLPNPHPWMYNHVYHHNATSSHHEESSHTSSYSGYQQSWHGHSTNMHSNDGLNWQDHSTNMNSNGFNSNAEIHSSGSPFGSSVLSLWDKLDSIERDTIPSHAMDSEIGSTQHHQQFGSTVNKQDDKMFIAQNTIIKPLQPSPVSNTTIKPTEAINKEDKVRLIDIGRGDIAADDVLSEPTETPILITSKPHKTPEEIETLSLTKDTNKTEHHNVVNNKDVENILTVMSLDQQKQLEIQDKENARTESSVTGITTLKNNYHYIHSLNDQNDNKQKQLEFQDKEHAGTQNSATATSSTTQRNGYHYIHNIHDQNKEEKESSDMEHQFESRGQENLDQQSLVHQFEEVEPDNIHQQNTDQQLVDFGQHNEQTEQQFEKQNIGQSESFHFGQHNEQTEQQFETQSIGQNEGFHQENMKHQDDLGQQSEQFDQISLTGWQQENLGQQEHQLEDWGQQNDNLEQQSQTGWNQNSEGQVDLMPAEDLQQQSQLTDTFEQTEAVEDFNQRVKPVWEPSEGLQQQSQLTNSFPETIDQNQEVPSASHNKEEVSEDLIVPKKVAAVESPPEENTEKSGFWKSVGNKFSNAKDKVKSWFSS